MEIRYFGHSHFVIKGKEYSIMLDPFSNVGLKEFKVKTDYVFCSHNHFDHNNSSLSLGAKPVENEKPFEIIKSLHDDKGGTLRGENNVLLFVLDGIKIAFLGDLGEYDNENLISKLKGVDILIIPVGGVYTVDDLGAYNYAMKIQPKTIIPMHYKIEGSTVDINCADKFLQRFSKYETKKSPYQFDGTGGVIRIISEQKGDL